MKFADFCSHELACETFAECVGGLWGQGQYRVILGQTVGAHLEQGHRKHTVCVERGYHFKCLTLKLDEI